MRKYDDLGRAVENSIIPQVVLDAIALAITDDRATGKVYNIAEAQFPTEAQRIRRIGQVAG
ncbi:MAG: hypothetical protein RIM23_00810 [Coleofasciculus sp. G3-WIS-01]|uniref:hypothetical protein n=1 Tax=Coleofasciculus sp. G3-WIS-01 TaxID=3069528 RepID=UPI0032F697C1